MSRVSRLGVLAAMWLSWSPGVGTAQQTEEELLQRLDSLRPLLEVATEELRAFEYQLVERSRIEAAAQAKVDTVRVGMMTIVTPVGQAGTARELFSEVWDEHYSNVVRSPGLEGSVFTFQWTDDPVPIHIVENLREIKFSRWVRRNRLKDQIRHAIGVSITYDLSAQAIGAKGIGRWVGGEPHREHDLARIYRQLATTRSVATRRCMEGDVDSCMTALGLGVDEGSAIEAWYTPAERRALVAGASFLGVMRNNSGAWEACVFDSDQPACDGLLRTQPRRWAPLPGSVRASLLSLALESGGRGAWSRIVEDPTMSPEAALEYASGVPLSTLLAEWRSRVVENRPDVYGSLGAHSGVALMWALFFAALAMRSTRWRLG